MPDQVISSILCIGSFNLSYAIEERIERQQSFTTVTDADPKGVATDGIALLCLNKGFGFENFQITHVCLLKKGSRVATNQVRFKGTNVIPLPAIDSKEVIALLPSRFKKQAETAFSTSYTKISPKFGEELYKAILKLCEEQAKKIEQLNERLNAVMPRDTRPRHTDAAAEKDALAICLDIFGVDRSEIMQSWGSDNGTFGDSFLSGLNDYTAYEDDIISNDLHTLPGWALVSEAITGVVEFENGDGEKLVVINANRKPQEKAMGVDLIYFHRKYEAFTFVQYKMMDQKNKDSDEQYYNPNQKSHTDELRRMDRLQTLLDEGEKSTSLKDYRFSNSSIYFKLCKKLEIKKADAAIATGAYIPLQQWKILIGDTSTKGSRDGHQLGYHTIKNRYIGTGTFIELIKKGFIGTNNNTSKIGTFIEAAIKEGHSVMYAIDNRKEKSSPQLKRRNITTDVF
ncbi:hypothetical protein ACFGVS_08050 [Mucilaginibacter sp. AW1-7]|jgi:hypothetical protein|uniref:hypothetical protein n=1 Tax=Mucilaginibacter sp. AW1-7 TaxID=3349874 RepID=UPI003F73BEC2